MLNKPTKVLLVFIPLLICLSGFFVVRAETAEPDELWLKAVQVATQNQGLIPDDIQTVTKEHSTGLGVRVVEEKEHVKTIVSENEVKVQQWNYAPDLSDLTLPFISKTQQNIDVCRLKKFETRNGQKCVVYNFKCLNVKGDRIKGKAWINESGVPIAMNYTFDLLPERIPRQIKSIIHEVQYTYQSDGSWYPNKLSVHVKLKLLSFIHTTHRLEYTFGNYHKPKDIGSDNVYQK